MNVRKDELFHNLLWVQTSKLPPEHNNSFLGLAETAGEELSIYEFTVMYDTKWLKYKELDAMSIGNNQELVRAVEMNNEQYQSMIDQHIDALTANLTDLLAFSICVPVSGGKLSDCITFCIQKYTEENMLRVGFKIDLQKLSSLKDLVLASKCVARMISFLAK